MTSSSRKCFSHSRVYMVIWKPSSIFVRERFVNGLNFIQRCNQRYTYKPIFIIGCHNTPESIFGFIYIYSTLTLYWNLRMKRSHYIQVTACNRANFYLSSSGDQAKYFKTILFRPQYFSLKTIWYFVFSWSHYLVNVAWIHVILVFIRSFDQSFQFVCFLHERWVKKLTHRYFTYGIVICIYVSIKRSPQYLVPQLF